MMQPARSNIGVLTVPGIDHIPTDEDWNILLQKARDLEARIQTVQGKQNDYNQVLQRCYVVEEAQRMQMAELQDRVRKEEVNALTNPDFARWLSNQDETMATEQDLIGNWYHDNALLAATPFSAVVPFPRYLTEKGSLMCEQAINTFEISPYYVVTVPVKSSVTQLCQALVPGATHLLPDEIESRISLGPFAYLTAPQYNGGSVLRLIEDTPILKEGLMDTNCLLLRDAPISPDLVIKCLVVRGRCTVAELGCPEKLVPLFHRGTAFTREDGATRNISSPLLGHDIIAYALGAYVKSVLTPVLKTRTYEAILVGNISGLKDVEEGSASSLEKLVSHLSMKDVSFQVLNIDYPDNSNFDMYQAEDVRHMSGYVLRRDQHGRGQVVVPPALRMVERGGTFPLSPTVALLTRQLENSAVRYQAYCGGEEYPLPICSMECTEPSTAQATGNGSPGGESNGGEEVAIASAPHPPGRLSAAHMDPFLNLRVSNGVPYLVPPGAQPFFSETEAIHRVLGRREEHDQQ